MTYCDAIGRRERLFNQMLNTSKFKTAVLALTFCLSVCAAAQAAAAEKQTVKRGDGEIRAGVLASLHADHFKNVSVDVKKGVVSLTGSVELYAYKAQANTKAQHVKGTTAVRDQIEVAGPRLPDDELQRKLLEKVQYDRVGYGTTAFNAISVSVRGGVATLGGHAYGPVDKDSALSLAAYMPGIRDVIDEIQVDPLSPMDDRVRLAVARSVYGFPSLNKYAIDPAKPIRISVQNGNVTLFGMVDNQMDKDTAALQANLVPGVFSVSNELQVSSSTTKRE